MKKLLLSVALLATINSFGQTETLLQDFNYTVTDQTSFDAAVDDMDYWNASPWSNTNGATFIYTLGYTVGAGQPADLAGFPVGEQLVYSRVYSTSTGTGPDNAGDYASLIGFEVDLEDSKTYDFKFDTGLLLEETYDRLIAYIAVFDPNTGEYIDDEPIWGKDYTSADRQKQTIQFEIPSDEYESGQYLIYFMHTLNELSPNSATPGGYLGGVILDKVTLVETGTLSTNSVVASKFAVFPNPSNGSDVVNFSGDNIQATGATIFNLLGKKVITASQSELANKQINISALAKGMYLLNIETNEGVATKKIIKN